MVQIACWTPYAILVLWTIILPPETLNIHYTMLPSICCKVIIWLFLRLLKLLFQLAPVLNALLVWWNIPRVTSAYFYLKNGKMGSVPQEVFDYKVEMNAGGEREERESLNN